MFHLSTQVLCEAVYYAAYVRRLRPEDQDVLVEFPRVERVVQRVSRVRPPQGFALSQARQQARKVHMLHTMLKVGENKSGGDARGRARPPRPDAFCLDFSEFPGVYVFPVGGFAAQLLGLGQGHARLETASSAPASAPHARLPPRQQVHPHALHFLKSWDEEGQQFSLLHVFLSEILTPFCLEDY